jgi:hypothetical protein
MTKYLIIDTANLFYRARHAVSGDPYSKAGLALHAVFRSIRKMWREYGGEHVVFCLEGKSWRFDSHPKYKAHRRVLDLTLTAREREENQIFSETFTELTEFLVNKTNATVLQKDRVEGDDFIARWIQMHPHDSHLIVSGDTDFIQLLEDNVQIYDGVRELLITKDFVKDVDGDMVEFTVTSSGKLKIGKKVIAGQTYTPEPQWWRRALFMKCIRGDAGDNIFSAYPKVREVKMKAAWEDRHDRGFDWNNLFLQTWTDYDENDEPVTVKVMDKYKFNESLIDLTQQPDDIKALMDDVIVERVQKTRVGNVGIHMLRFCDKNGLVNISKEATDHTSYLNAPYSK